MCVAGYNEAKSMEKDVQHSIGVVMPISLLILNTTAAGAMCVLLFKYFLFECSVSKIPSDLRTVVVWSFNTCTVVIIFVKGVPMCQNFCIYLHTMNYEKPLLA